MSMHPASQTIKAIIDAHPGFSLNQLLKDLGANMELPLPKERLLNMKLVRQQLSVCKTTVFNWVKDGKLNPVYLAGNKKMLRFRESEVSALRGEV